MRKVCKQGVRGSAPLPSPPARRSTRTARPSARLAPLPTPTSASSSVPGDAVYVRPPVVRVPPVPRPRGPSLPVVPSFNESGPSTRKRSALAPPSSSVPSSSKVLRSSKSSSTIRRPPSAVSSSPSLPSPLVFSSSLPSHLPVRMVVDPPMDQFMVLLDSLEFAIERGNLEDARTRIRAIRNLCRQ
jgi:hypothetical protein